MIKINNITKSYKDRLVLSIEALQIPEKQIFGIVGGNGCGKSTLLKIMSDLIRADKGQVIRNCNLDEMVYLFQKPHLFNTSVYKNIEKPLKYRNIQKSIRALKVQKMLDLFDLNHIKNQNARKLSGGEAQKVNLARALVFEPKVILLDEPTANIDQKSTRFIEDVLLGLDISIILVTHNLTQAKRLCKEIAILDEGRLVLVAPSEEAVNHPLLQYI